MTSAVRLSQETSIRGNQASSGVIRRHQLPKVRLLSNKTSSGVIRTHLTLVAMREQPLPILTSQHGHLDTRSAHQQPQPVTRARRASAKHGKLLLSQSREGQGAVVSTCMPEQSS